MNLRIGILLAMIALSGCEQRQGKTAIEDEAKVVEAILKRAFAVDSLEAPPPRLPSPITEGHFLEEQRGDGRLGPSDFMTFWTFTVPVDRIDSWTSALKELSPQNDPAVYAAPQTATGWWVTGKQFGQLTFYSAKEWTGRVNGWVGLNEATGEFFVYSFTM